MKRNLCCLLWVGLIAGGSAVNAADDPATENPDRVAIRKAITSYVAAFNARDASRLASHWSPEGVYTSRITGEQITGRAALEKDFASLFAEEKGTKLSVATESIDFVSPNVALERGTAIVMRPDAEPEHSHYRVVLVRRDGQWLIDRETEEAEPEEAPSHYEQLKDLEWMLGTWVDQDGGEVIKTSCRWSRNRNFIVRTFTATIDDEIYLTGMQLVGWDAARKQIRSWVFDSDGGVSEGVWRRSGGQWMVQATATLADGSLASSTSVLRPLGEDSFAWRKINRVVAGEILPNIDEVVIVRE